MLRMNILIIILYYTFLINMIYFEDYTKVEAITLLVSCLYSKHKIFGSVPTVIKQIFWHIPVISTHSK